MANKYIKKSSKSLVIREIQIITIIRYHCTFTRMDKIKNTIRNIGEDGEQLECSHIPSGNV